MMKYSHVDRSHLLKVKTPTARLAIGLALCSAVALGWAGCATEQPKKKSRTRVAQHTPPQGISVPPSQDARTGAQETNDYREIQGLYSKGSFEAALQKLAAFEKKYPNSKLNVQTRNLRGLSYLLTKRPLQAIHYFQKALEATGTSSFRQYILYNLAAAQFEAGQPDNTQQTLLQINPEGLDKEARIKFYSLRSRLETNQGLHAPAARDVLTLSRLIEDPQQRSPFAQQLDLILEQISDPTILEVMYRDFEDSPLADLVLFRLGARELAQGQSAAGEMHLRLLLERYPQTFHYAEANELLKARVDQAEVDSTAIGVLLPIKGKFAQFGEQSLRGIQLAFQVFGATEPDHKINLIVEDSGEDGEQAIKALNTLYFKHHVVAVIGPLLSKGIDQVTRRAEDLGLPLITLAQQSGHPGENVFQAGLTMKLQAHAAARYAIDRLGLQKFAILHSRDKYGEQFSNAYWDAVDSLGGKIVGIESYTAGETDFRQPIDKLSGLYYTEARQRELEELAKAREENKITKRTRKTDRFFSLPPIVDYEAVFVPDDPKMAGQILPTFAYRDVEKVKFIGTSSWNSPEFPTRVQNTAEGALFVDAFFAESSSTAVRNFVSRYKSTFELEPGAMEALAYDAANIVKYALSKDLTQKRADLREKLKDVHNFPGVTGKITYKDGQFSRDLTILTIRGGKIVEAN